MGKGTVAGRNNMVVSAEIRDGYIWATTMDGRIVGLPLNWFAWLDDATPQQQNNFVIEVGTLWWPEFDDGIDSAMLGGNHSRDHVTVQQMAKMHNITTNTIYRILRAEDESDLDDDQRRIPGAFYEGEGRRRIWFIPRKAAETFVPDARGRKS